jgi:tyrosyl-DNA phosphodiesterase-1
MRYDNKGGRRIDWAMVTSANLSKQAWGDVENTKGEVWVQSWECGVVVWPALFSDEEDARDVIMVPVFRRDVPDIKDIETREASFGNIRKPGVKYDILREGERTVVGFRMPYDLPVWPYKEGDVPWCATAAYEEPDWKGQVWGGYGG